MSHDTQSAQAKDEGSTTERNSLDADEKQAAAQGVAHKIKTSVEKNQAFPASQRNDSLIRSEEKNTLSWSKVLKAFSKFFAFHYYEKPPSPHSDRVIPRVILNGCTTPDEHYDRIKEVRVHAKNQRSLKGLEAIGFTYKFTPCDRHPNETCTKEKYGSHPCPCGTRLVHMSSNTLITKVNRIRYIADGDMYEVVVRLCQEYAQDLMMSEASLHWVSVCEDKEEGNPIRILVDHDFPIYGDVCQDAAHGSMHNNIGVQRILEDDYENSREKSAIETLLITTGKGKVRAGIFSRQHLLVSGIEASTALPMVRDAKRRNMSICILDPNARGDRYGMATYQQSMRVLFGSASELKKDNEAEQESKIGTGSIYVLAHSASGSQLTRYLQTDGSHLLSRIKSIAFTDSNHSIQWLKNHSQISSFFESSATLYIRSSNEERDYGWEHHNSGDVVNTTRDDYWLHRFGKTLTIWAGTTDHSLTNFTSHRHIWDHFDRHRNQDDEGNEETTNDPDHKEDEEESEEYNTISKDDAEKNEESHKCFCSREEGQEKNEESNNDTGENAE